jgi:uncharacterized protein (TIGR00266 family)
MKIEKRYGPSATVAICHLDAGESLVTESGALLAIKGQVEISTSTKQRSGGTVFGSLKRLVSGESFFLNTYTARDPSEVWLGTALPGDLLIHDLKGDKLIIQGGSYVGGSPEIEIDLEWQGLKSLFSGESLFWVKARGHGKVIANSFGFIYPIQVNGDYIVDTGHIVAFEETLDFEISKASRSLLQTFLGGEGFVCRFRGRGTVWCQSHSPLSFGQELTPYLRHRSSHGR